MARGIEGIEHELIAPELIAQRGFLAAREPAYARTLDLLADAIRGELGERLAATWAEREFNAFYERPLLLLAALRYDALCEGASHPLHAALASATPSAQGLDAQALARATSEERKTFHRTLRERAVQTNETTRAITWLWPASLLGRAGETRPLALVDLGASAGLNLIADELPMPWIDEQGAALALVPRPGIGLRLGLDLAPLDVRAEEAAIWLRACVWPSDQPRLLRLEQGIAHFRAAASRADGPRLETCTLPEAPARLAELPSGMLALCMQIIVRDYLSPKDRERYEHGMRELLVARPPRSMLWVTLELEPNGGSAERAVAITTRFLDAQGALRELLLARTHPHPQQLFCDATAANELCAAWRSG
jgi:hypothetical protein